MLISTFPGTGQTKDTCSQIQLRRELIDQLKACSKEKNLTWGKVIHHSAILSSDDTNVFVASMLIKMYGLCRSMKDAVKVFHSLRQPDVVCWNALILGYAENGESKVALKVFFQMHLESCDPNEVTFLAVLRACSNLPLINGKKVHLLALVSGRDLYYYVQTALVDMYAKCASLNDSRLVFDKMKYQNVVSWTSLISGYADIGKTEDVFELFMQMVSGGCTPNEATLVAVLKALENVSENIEKARKLHVLALSNGSDGMHFQSRLIVMYGECRNLKEAHAVFSYIKKPDVVCWNVLIMGYAENGECETALALLLQMKSEGFIPDTFTLLAAIKACTQLALKSRQLLVYRERGKMVHLIALQCGCSSAHLQCSLVDMYAKCRSMNDAIYVFNRMSSRNVVCWTSLILGYTDNGESERALEMFFRMWQEGCAPEARAFVSALKACTNIKEENALEKGKALHLLASGFGCDSDVFVANTLIHMYSKSGKIKFARKVFNKIKHRDSVSWTALILGYVNHGDGETALCLFPSMIQDGCAPINVTFAAVLKASGNAGALDIGRNLHNEICQRGLENDDILKSCLIHFYSKCGNIAEAERVFGCHATRDPVTWNALLTGYCRHGNMSTAFKLLGRMLESSIQPDGVTFSIILTACSHGGLLERGKCYFDAMFPKYGINPNLEHYTCMIDMLSRVKRLCEAMELLERMPFVPSVVTWTCILGASVRWKYFELGKIAFECLVCLNDQSSIAYVLMANAKLKQLESISVENHPLSRLREMSCKDEVELVET